jgi:hypothetical protein
LVKIQHDNIFFTQTQGLAMGAPTFNLFSEIYLQFLEHNMIYKILIEQHIVAYFRYVDDILIVYNSEYTHINGTLSKFNQSHPTLLYSL